MEPLLVAAAIVVAVTVVASVARRRRDPPTQSDRRLPTQLDRTDFEGAERDWLVVVFSSSSCSVCAGVIERAGVLASRSVAVQAVAYEDRRDLHRRYGVDAVPALIIADRQGVVRYAHLGPVTATDLWAAMAEVRQPGSVAFGDGCARPD